MAKDPSEEAADPASRGATGPAHSWQINALGLGLIGLALLLVYLLATLWPSGLAPDAKGSDLQSVCLRGISSCTQLSVDVRLLLTVLVVGALGSFVHTATSFGDFVGNGKLGRSWIWWYLLKPFIGMALAAIFYLVIRGGFLSQGSDAGQINVFGIAALAGLAGMFSKQATDKLSEVFNTLFKTDAGGGDARRGGSLRNAKPVLTELQPDSVEPATRNLAVTVKGSGFVESSVVRVNGSNRETRFEDGTRLSVKLLPEDVRDEGELELLVSSPAPGGGDSRPIKLKIAAPSTVAGEHDDGCDVPIVDATPDEALPATRGGIAS